MKQLEESIGVSGAETAADADVGDSGILNGDLAHGVAVELRDGLSERRVVEGDVAPAPGEEPVGVCNRVLIDDDVCVGGSCDGASSEKDRATA